MFRLRNVSIFLKIHLFKNFCWSFNGSQLCYSIEVFVNLTFYGLKQLEGYGIFLTRLIATYFRRLLSEIICVLFYIIELLIFRVIVLVVIMYILNLFHFLLLCRKCTFSVKTYFICQI